jgi:hypothetical protein
VVWETPSLQVLQVERYPTGNLITCSAVINASVTGTWQPDIERKHQSLETILLAPSEAVAFFAVQVHLKPSEKNIVFQLTLVALKFHHMGH